MRLQFFRLWCSSVGLLVATAVSKIQRGLSLLTVKALANFCQPIFVLGYTVATVIC